LIKAGVEKQTRVEKGARGRDKLVVWWIGLGVDKEKWATGEKLLEARVTGYTAPPIQSVVPSQSAASHVRVNGILYSKELIGTVRPIRGFKHHQTGEEMKYIVTFTNPELKHQYLGQRQGEELERILGRKG
jgi:hypothetical protein